MSQTFLLLACLLALQVAGTDAVGCDSKLCKAPSCTCKGWWIFSWESCAAGYSGTHCLCTWSKVGPSDNVWGVTSFGIGSASGNKRGEVLVATDSALYRSTDAGLSFSKILVDRNMNPNIISVHRVQTPTDTAYFACTSNGLYRSYALAPTGGLLTNGIYNINDAWTKVINTQSQFMRGLASNKAGSALFTVEWGGDADNLRTSSDGGKTWGKTSNKGWPNGAELAVAALASVENTLYAWENFKGLYSLDITTAGSTATWQAVGTGLSVLCPFDDNMPICDVQRITPFKGGLYVAAMGRGLGRLDLTSKKWSKVAVSAKVDSGDYSVTDVAVDANGSEMYLIHDQGMFVSTDGVKFTEVVTSGCVGAGGILRASVIDTGVVLAGGPQGAYRYKKPTTTA